MLLIFQDFENIVFENWLSEYSFGKLAFASVCVCVLTKQTYIISYF